MKIFTSTALLALMASLTQAAPGAEPRQFQAQIIFEGAPPDADGAFFSLSVPTDGSVFPISIPLHSIANPALTVLSQPFEHFSHRVSR
jgi:hypothetical protein